MYNHIFIILAIVSIVTVASSPSVTFALPKMDAGDPGGCTETGDFAGPNGLAVINCCWYEKVEPGTGGYGPDKSQEMYCMNCEDGGDRGNINCSDPELQYRQGGKPLPPISGTIDNGQISDDPSTSNNDNQNPDIAPKGGLTDRIDDLQSSNNNILEAIPESNEGDDADGSQQREANPPQRENSSDSSPN